MAAETVTPRRGSEPRTIVFLLVLFGLLTIAFTYPISTSPNTYLSELADVRLITWMLAWNAHAFATDPLNVFDANIFFPNQGALAYSEPFLAPSAIVAPINWAGYPVLAYNLILLSSFVLSGLGATLWVRHMTGNLGAGVVAGVIWAFAPGKFDQIAHLHMMVGQWIPFALLACSLYVESGRPRYLWATAGLAALQFAFSMHYGVFLLPVVALYGVTLLSLMPEAGARAGAGKLLRDLATAGVIYGLLLAPLALPFVGSDNEVGVERQYAEMLRYSARPRSFLSGSPHNRAAHVAWLHDRYRAVEANYFPGVLPILLAGVALFGLLPPTLGAAAAGLLGRSRRSERAPPLWSLRFGVFVGGLLLSTGAFALHLAGFVAAYQREAAWSASVAELCRTLDPSLWLAVGATVTMLAVPVSALRGIPRWRLYLLVISYLTLITYLLAYGPEVRGFAAQLGRGPYWLLYRFVLPFQGIRAAGRIGLLWILFVAALAGFAFARLQGRVLARGWSVAPESPSTLKSASAPFVARAAIAVTLALLVWEFRVWPLPHEVADVAGDPADAWLAEQRGEFSVVHAPIESGPQAWRETRYMLGSTLHWKWLVNGYSGFFPADYEYLAEAGPLTPEFFARLRADFPVRYLLVHQDRLANDAQQARLRRLLSRKDEAVFVQQLGDTYVFEVPRETEAGDQLRRRYTSAQLQGQQGLRFWMRAPGADPGGAIVVFGWGGGSEITWVTESWTGFRVDLPEGYVDSLSGGPGAFDLRTHTLVPVGDTGARVVSGFTIDAQRQASVVGVHSRLFHRSEGPALVAHRLAEFGTSVAETRVFEATAAGAANFRGYLDSLPQGTLVATSVLFDAARVLDTDTTAALRLIGADPPADEEVRMMVTLGVRGAGMGAALQHVHHSRAVIDIEVVAPIAQARGIGLF